jgi:hypothetical protein
MNATTTPANQDAPTKPKSEATLAAPSGSAIHEILEYVKELRQENARHRTALLRISKWFGEFPPTGRTWEDGTAMSYSAAFGSNGERDYMRQVADDALSPNDPDQRPGESPKTL